MLAIFALVVFRIVSGTPIDLGSTPGKLNTSCCLTDVIIRDFDVQKFGKYNGSWWATKYYQPVVPDFCLNPSFKVHQNNSMTSEEWSGPANGHTKLKHQTRYFRQPDPSNSGNYQIYNNSSSTDVQDVWFLGSDYATYTVTYTGCNTFDGKCEIMALILTSEQEPDNSVYEKALQVAESYGLQRTQFVSLNMINCGSHNYS